MEITVAKIIDEYTIVINKGSDSGIKNGQRILIFTIGDEINDPNTGESLGKLEIIKGTGRVTHCQSKLSTVSSDMKNSASRTIRRNPGVHSLREIFGYSQEEVEETLPAKKIPFETAKIGDLVKII